MPHSFFSTKFFYGVVFAAILAIVFAVSGCTQSDTDKSKGDAIENSGAPPKPSDAEPAETATGSETVNEEYSTAHIREKIIAPEIPDVRIEFIGNDAFGAYTRAVEEKKAVVIVFDARPCSFCNNMLDQFRCPAVSRYAGRFVFSYSTRGEDEGGDKLASALNVQRFPTTVVLTPDENRLHVIGRIEGVFSPLEIHRVFEEAMSAEALAELAGPQTPLPSVEDTAARIDEMNIDGPGRERCGDTDRN